ncbi:MAG: hypothetical protein ACRD3W_12940 [Terriglobales bacterium]
MAVVEEQVQLKRGRGRPGVEALPLVLTRKDSRKLLEAYDAKAMVDLLEKCYGSPDQYARCFDNHLARLEDILARTLFILGQPGNEEELQRWNTLVESHRQAKLTLAKQEALRYIVNIPKPIKKSKLTEKIEYAKFWQKVLEPLKAAPIIKPTEAPPEEPAEDPVDPALEFLAQIEGEPNAGD